MMSYNYENALNFLLNLFIELWFLPLKDQGDLTI